MLLVATSVMSLQRASRRRHRAESCTLLSGTGPFSWYIILSSKKTTGLSSRIAAFEQAFGVVWRGRQHDFQSGNMAEPGVQDSGYAGRRNARGTEGCAQDHRHFELAAGHVMDLRRLIHDLIHRQSDEIAEHDVHHRPHPGHGRADADAGEYRPRKSANQSRASVPNSFASPESTLNGVPPRRHLRR